MPKPASNAFTVNGDRLVASLLQVDTYCATAKAIPVLTGVAMKLGAELELATAAGFRLAIDKPGIPLSGERPDSGVGARKLSAGAGHALEKGGQAPGHQCSTDRGAGHQWQLDVYRPPGGGPRNMRMVEDGNHISFSFGTVTLCSQLLQGSFPNYQQLIPETAGGRRVQVRGADLLRGLNQVANIAGQESSIARLKWSGVEIVITAIASDVGRAEVTIKAVVEGVDTEIAFNITHLQGYLKGKTSVVTIATAPAVMLQ